jgi:3-hydroxyisobutyrate dehydrogenase-like beta-hydroxyacid dehydrogenase
MTQSPTIAVLYPGDMGASLAAPLRAAGARVVTTVAGRGDRTTARARQAEFILLDSLAEVVKQSDVVISLVPPAAAEATAVAYCALAHLSPHGALYVDANSIGPEQARALAERVTQTGRGFVDAAINGLAKNLTTTATLFLSGDRAGEIARLFDGALRMRVLGRQPGQASAMKMLLGGLSKGICALFLELALLAERREMLPELMNAASEIYPGIAELIERMLPTYARHSARRATEMSELQATALAIGQQPYLIEAIVRLHEMVAGASFDAPVDAGGEDAASLVRHLAREKFLALEAPDQSGNRIAT